MTKGKVDLVAVGVAGVLVFALQAGWYTLFMAQWLVGAGKTAAELQQGGSPAVMYGVAFVSNLAIAYAVGWVTAATGEQTAGRGIRCGLVLWLGLIATTLATNYAAEERPLSFFGINAGMALIAVLVSGAIVGRRPGVPRPKSAEHDA
jgi:hypothetical protein